MECYVLRVVECVSSFFFYFFLFYIIQRAIGEFMFIMSMKTHQQELYICKEKFLHFFLNFYYIAEGKKKKCLFPCRLRCGNIRIHVIVYLVFH